MAESPVGVNHSAGITTAADWVNALNGYQYDSMNPDALTTQATIMTDGSIAMPGGVSYRVLVVPQQDAMNPSAVSHSDKVAEKIETFRNAGGIVIEKPYQEADFSDFGLPRDITLPEGIAYTHRKDGAEDIYFLSNQTDTVRIFACLLRAKSDTVMLYDALTDRYMPAARMDAADGMWVGIELPAYGSVFVLCSPKSAVNVKSTPFAPAGHRKMPLEGLSWNVRFKENGKEITMNRLQDWTEHASDSVRYYSGQAAYETVFELKRPRNGRVWLDLGRVCDVAHVFVDGSDCGTAWTAPYRVDVTDALKKQSRHTLRIVVTNTWANALLGNDTGHAPFAGIWTNASYRLKGQNLLPAGLLGPVSVWTDDDKKK